MKPLTPKERVLRVQDVEGRGPWKPGFSKHWRDETRDIPQPWFVEFQGIDMHRELGNGHLGCGCRSLEQLRKWFSEEELANLSGLGYLIVELDADRIVCESENQVVFWRHKPLAKGACVAIYAYRPTPRAAWERAAEPTSPSQTSPALPFDGE